MRFVLTILVVLTCLAGVGPASAQSWDFGTDPQRADGTGGGVILLGALNRQSRLVAVCHPSRVATLSFLTDDRRSLPARPQDTGVTIEFDIDGFRTRAGAAYHEPGDGRVGLTLTDAALVRKVVEEIAKAKFGVSLTIRNPAIGASGEWIGGVGGAAAAGSQFVDYCFRGRDLPAAPAAAAPAAPVAAGAGQWSFYTAPGGASVLSVEAGQGDGTLFFACDGRKRLSMIYLADEAASVPVGPADRSIALDVSVDGLSWSGAASYHSDTRGAGIAFVDHGTIFDMLAAISVARSDVTLGFRGQGERHARTFPTGGVAQPARQFFSACL